MVSVEVKKQTQTCQDADWSAAGQDAATSDTAYTTSQNSSQSTSQSTARPVRADAE